MTQTLMKMCAGCVLLAAFSFPAVADAWQERESLARFKDQLERSLSLLQQAESASKGQSTRARIVYPNIREDVKIIIKGIDIALSKPMMPADVEPMLENYFSYERAE